MVGDDGRKVNIDCPVWINVQTAEVLENGSTRIRIPDNFKARPEFGLVCSDEDARTLFCSPTYKREDIGEAVKFPLNLLKVMCWA